MQNYVKDYEGHKVACLRQTILECPVPHGKQTNFCYLNKLFASFSILELEESLEQTYESSQELVDQLSDAHNSNTKEE